MLHVKVEKGEADRKLSVSNINSALFFMTAQAHMDMNLYAPKKQGHLRDKSFVNRNRITYAVPYALPQFRGFVNGSRIRNYTTAGTSRRWDLRAKANHMDDWRKAFIKGGNL